MELEGTKTNDTNKVVTRLHYFTIKTSNKHDEKLIYFSLLFSPTKFFAEQATKCEINLYKNIYKYCQASHDILQLFIRDYVRPVLCNLIQNDEQKIFTYKHTILFRLSISGATGCSPFIFRIFFVLVLKGQQILCNLQFI